MINDNDETTKLCEKEIKKNDPDFYSLLDPDNILIRSNNIGMHVLRPTNSKKKSDHTYLLIEHFESAITREIGTDQSIEFILYDFHYNNEESKKEITLKKCFWLPASVDEEKYMKEGLKLLMSFLKDNDLALDDCEGQCFSISGEKFNKLIKNLEKNKDSKISALETSGQLFTPSTSGGSRNSLGWCTYKVKESTGCLVNEIRPLEHKYLKQKKESVCLVM